jgi:cell division protein FtsB
MDRYEELVAENDALKAIVTRLNEELTGFQQQIKSLQDKNESLEDENEILKEQKKYLEDSQGLTRSAWTDSLEKGRRDARTSLRTIRVEKDHWHKMWQICKDEVHRLRNELMRRGADDPWKPKPQCETALAALNLVRHWDRDARIDELWGHISWCRGRMLTYKTGREVLMEDVTKAMREDGYYWMPPDWDNKSLHDVLAKLYNQIRFVDMNTQAEARHPVWDNFPLVRFTSGPDTDSEMEE